MRDGETPARAFRIGIDVGGTFTKAVLINNETREIAGRYSVLTTHDHPRGVAAGVVEVFRSVLTQSGVDPREVVFLAHSTTQATNALLEGDVTKVGILGMAGEAAAKLAKDQAKIDPIELAPGCMLDTANQFLVSDDADHDAIENAIAALKAEGAEVLVASCAFGVDNTTSEEQVRELGAQQDLLTTCGHEITRLYGLTTRTRTAVINASILPRMNATASLTEQSVREAGITAPLMIMRGDGGVMDIQEMRRRPATTMLSGPAASVAGALMHLRVSDGLYFEVGGTSTNIGVIRNGRPTVAYANIGGHDTYVSSLDVRVVGIAGGSLVRAVRGKLVDVGPRSAHIAGLPYAAFADPDAVVDPKIEPFEPKAGDAEAYIAIKVADGTRYALTTTCAANVLGYAQPGMHAYGNPEAARKAFASLAEYVGTTVEGAARTVLEMAAAKVTPVIDGLIKDYKLDADQCLLIGEGGGAGALVPFVAGITDLKYEISKDAEVISSIGVALALVRDVVERIIPHPQPEDLQAIRTEALDAAVRMGADPKSVDVTVEIDEQTQQVRATAVGAAEMHVKDASGAIHEREARRIAAEAMELAIDEIDLVAATEGFRVYQQTNSTQGRVRAVDWQGTVRLRRRSARVFPTVSNVAIRTINEIWAVAAPDQGHHHSSPEVMMLHGRHITDLSGVPSADQAAALVTAELEGTTSDAPVIFVRIADR